MALNKIPKRLLLHVQWVAVKRLKATTPVASAPATAAVGVRDAVRGRVDSVDQVEWRNAKPFQQIPGPKLWPLLGSSWVILPIVGK